MQTRKKHDTGCSVSSCQWTVHENVGDYCVCRTVPSVQRALNFTFVTGLVHREPCASLKVKNALEQSVYCLAACAIYNRIIAALIPAMSVCLSDDTFSRFMGHACVRPKTGPRICCSGRLIIQLQFSSLCIHNSVKLRKARQGRYKLYIALKGQTATVK